MNSTLIVQAVLSGITNGFVYALIGIGMAVIFKGARVINAMQGEFAVIAGMVTVLFLDILGFPYAVSALAGILAGAATGIVVEVSLVKPMIRRGAPEESFLLLTIGLAVTISAAVLYIAGRGAHLLPPIGGDVSIEILGAYVLPHSIWLVGISLAVVAVLKLFFDKTILGLSMSAASMDPAGARITGINVSLMQTYTFVLGGAMGALAGLLATPLFAVSYQIGLALTLKGFAAAILGGLTNPLGALVGGLVIGLCEALAVVGLSSGYRDIVAIVVMIAMMIVRPQGLLGRRGRAGG